MQTLYFKRPDGLMEMQTLSDPDENGICHGTIEIEGAIFVVPTTSEYKCNVAGAAKKWRKTYTPTRWLKPFRAKGMTHSYRYRKDGTCVKRRINAVAAWHMVMFTSWQLFSKQGMTGYWLRGYTGRADKVVKYPYDHSNHPNVVEELHRFIMANPEPIKWKI